MLLLFSARETIATLVKYKCKTFITLTPALMIMYLSERPFLYDIIEWFFKKFCLGMVVTLLSVGR